jgi:hypothetical protein
LPAVAAAQSPTPPDAPKLSASGYLQPQYELRVDHGTTTDRALFRRMVVSLDAVLSTAWTAALQADAGPVASGEDRLIIKDAYLRHTGLGGRDILITVGNQKMPFSRSVLGSSSRRGLIERPFTGDRGFGSPGRALAVRLDGWHRRRTTYWSAAVASVRHSPDPDQIQLTGTAEAETGWNEGPLLGGRIEFHPWGEVPRAHGDFERGGLRVTAGAGAYRWWNDDDARAHGASAVDAARVSGFEISGALRGGGVSVDAEFEHITARALAPDTTAGLYDRGSAVINKMSVEAGYMIVARRVEALVAVDRLDAPVYAEPWRRASGGLNWYLNGHRLKFSLMHRESFQDRGVESARSRRTYVQAQIAF